MDYDQRFNEVLGVSSRSKDKQTATSSTTSNSWGRDESTSQQFYVTHGLQTPTMSSAVFVPANIVSQSVIFPHDEVVLFIPARINILAPFMFFFIRFITISCSF